ncbi:MAG TPA: shikimate kinase, partial [Planctomycetota bacterium]|nr:shikimate kinase [Planctomycetota bacterium]
MSDYYDTHPIRIPLVPISLVGFLGSGQDSVGLSVASLTALPLVDVHRLVEHEAGASIQRFVFEHGEAEFRRLEKEALRRALGSTPPGVVVLGHGTLIDEGNRAEVLSRSALVYVHYDLEMLRTKIAEDLVRQPGLFFPWIRDEEVSAEDLERFYSERRAGYEEATLQVDATGRAP